MGSTVRDLWDLGRFKHCRLAHPATADTRPDPTSARDLTTGDVRGQKWLSLNSFAARMLSAGMGWENLAIWQMRKALEETLDNQTAVQVDLQIAMANEWLKRSGHFLLFSAVRDQELNDSDKRALAAGPLFAGEPGSNPERWGFWKRRLGQIKG